MDSPCEFRWVKNCETNRNAYAMSTYTFILFQKEIISFLGVFFLVDNAVLSGTLTNYHSRLICKASSPDKRQMKQRLKKKKEKKKKEGFVAAKRQQVYFR